MTCLPQVHQPFGHSLLVVSSRAGFSDIFVVDPDSGDARNLTRSDGFTARYPSWAPDRQQVAFVSDRDGTENLFLMQADGSNPRLIEPLRYQMTVDGSRAPWKPAGRERQNSKP